MTTKAKKSGALVDVVGTFAKKAGVYAAVASVFAMSAAVYKDIGSSQYMVAANRFGLATEWGITDTGNAAGGDGRTGGNGTLYSRYNSRRYKFTTTWSAVDGIFLWANAANSVNGMLDGLFPVTIKRVEILTEAGVLVDTVKWSGISNKTLALGEKLWNDPIAKLAANTTYYLDIYCDGGTNSGSWPADQGFTLAGERSNDSASVDLSLSPMTGTSGRSGSTVGGYFAPSMFAAKGWDGITPVFCIFGDSIEDGTSVSAALAPARGDIGGFREGLGDTSGVGAFNYVHTSRWSSGPITLY